MLDSFCCFPTPYFGTSRMNPTLLTTLTLLGLFLCGQTSDGENETSNLAIPLWAIVLIIILLTLLILLAVFYCFRREDCSGCHCSSADGDACVSLCGACLIAFCECLGDCVEGGDCAGDCGDCVME